MARELRFLIFFTGLVCSKAALSQGTFVYDQQLVTNDTSGGEFSAAIQTNQPIGQSFTPTLSSVGFVRLFLGDSSRNGIGANVLVNLRSDSLQGPILASTDPVFMPDGFSGRADFLFLNEVSVIPGTTYFIQPVVQSGDAWNIFLDINYKYPGGTAFFSGVADPSFDLWFREGIIVPEPASGSLILLAIGIFVWRKRKWHVP